MSQFPTQAVRMISGESPSQFMSQSQDLRNTTAQIGGGRINSFGEEAQQSFDYSKKARLLKTDDQNGLLSSGAHSSDLICNMNLAGANSSKNNGESSHSVPDVAAAIEDLLEQTSKVKTLKHQLPFLCSVVLDLVSSFFIWFSYKIHDQKSPERNGCDKSVSLYSDYSFSCLIFDFCFCIILKRRIAIFI